MNPAQTVVNITLRKQKFELVFDLDAIAEAERLANRPLLIGLSRQDIATPTVDLVRATFFAGAHRRSPALTYERAKPFITPRNVQEVWLGVLKAWSLGMQELDAEEGIADPTLDPS
jgi:hypothetical protein